MSLSIAGTLQLYADDSSITYTTKEIKTLKTIIEADLLKIHEWFKNNLLVLNANKTKILFYNSTGRESNYPPDILLGDKKIEKVTEMKYLGLTIDSNLKWDPQVENVIKKIKPYIGVFRKISFLCSDKIKKMLYYSYIHSNLIYLLTIWSGTKKENIERIKILQNKCLRNLFYNKYKIGNISTKQIYKENEIMEFENMIKFEMLVNFHKMKNNQMKGKTNFELNKDIHTHYTRQSKQIRKIKTKNNYGKLSIHNRGANLYNNLPSPLIKEKKIRKFKNTIKENLLLKQFENVTNKKKKMFRK